MRQFDLNLVRLQEGGKFHSGEHIIWTNLDPNTYLCVSQDPEGGEEGAADDRGVYLLWEHRTLVVSHLRQWAGNGEFPPFQECVKSQP